MRRLKSIASGRTSVSDNLADSSVKSGKFEQEHPERQAEESNCEEASSSTNQHMASVSAGPLSAAKVGGSSMSTLVLKPTASAAEQLPKEMNEM
eukprot:c16857_g2_i1 orf=2-280(-)